MQLIVFFIAILLYFCCTLKSLEKIITVSTEILNRTNVYNTDNNKCYVSTKSAY